MGAQLLSYYHIRNIVLGITLYCLILCCFWRNSKLSIFLTILEIVRKAPMLAVYEAMAKKQ